MRKAGSPPDSNGLPFFELVSLATPNYQVGYDAFEDQLDFYLPFHLLTSFLTRLIIQYTVYISKKKYRKKAII